VSRNSEEGNTLSTPPQSPTPVEDEGSTSALTEDELLTAAPTVVANSLGEYLRAWGQRIKNGESGALPVLIGLIAIIIFFQLERSTFLTNGNLVNLLENSAIYVMLGAAETFVLLLSQIDLSLGFGAGVGAFVIAELIAPPVSLPWWLGILGGLLVMAALGLLQGSLIARLGLPSFIVTLGGYLGFQGIMLEVANVDKSAVGGTMTIADNSPVYKLVNSNMSTGLAWVVLIVCVALFAAITIMRSRSRRAQGLTTPPIGVTILTIAMAAIAGIVLVLVCNANRGNLAPLRGMPWVIPFVLLVLTIYSWGMARTRTGRYIYAVGANPEAARRAGINVKWILTFGFIMSSVTAGLAGLIYESQQGSMSTDIDGGGLVLFAVASAVIGGTSLFGGRGRIFNALLGGIVIATVFNGLGLMGVSAAVTDIVTAVVLIAAVALDSLVRARATAR
jgi:D-xylose transport system permease protein